MVGMLRSFFKPGASPGKMIIEARSYASACGSVTSIAIRKSAIMPFDVNHLWPLMTHSSPSSTAVVDSRVGSEPAVLGSVIEKAERILPSSSGCSQRFFCASVPNSARISELPESGAWLPKTIGAHTLAPSISCIRPSFTCPYPCPPSAGGRCVAQSFCFFTSACSGPMARMKPAWSVSSTSSGYTSSRTNPRIHSSFFSNSGSVEKSQAIPRLLVEAFEHGDALVDHAGDRIRQAFVHGVGSLPAPVEHEVVAEYRRVLVKAEGEVPAHLGGVGAVQPIQVFDPDVDGAAWVGCARVLAADRNDAQAAKVDQWLADLGDLPIEHSYDFGAAEQHVPVVVVAVDQRGRTWFRDVPGEQTAQLARPRGQLFGRALHEPGPAHHLGLQGHRLLVADAGAVRRQLLKAFEDLDRGTGDVEGPLLSARFLDACTLDCFHEHERPAVHHRLGGQDRNRGRRQARRVQRGHDAALADDVGRTGDACAGRGKAEDVAGRPVAIFDVHEIREPRMAFRDRIDGCHAQSRPSKPFAALRLEVRADALAHSR